MKELPAKKFKYESRNDILMRINQEAEEAYGKVELNAEINLLRSLVQELEGLWRRDPKQESEIVKNLMAIRTALETTEFVQPEDADRLESVIADSILKDGLFQYVKGKAMPMSPKTKMELTADIVSKIGRITRDNASVSASDYILVEDVKMRAEQTMKLFWRLVDSHAVRDVEDMKTEFVQEYSAIWANTPTRSQRGRKI